MYPANAKVFVVNNVMVQHSYMTVEEGYFLRKKDDFFSVIRLQDGKERVVLSACVYPITAENREKLQMLRQLHREMKEVENKGINLFYSLSREL